MNIITDYDELLALNLYERYKFDWILESLTVGDILQWTEECQDMIKEMQDEYEEEYDIDDYIYEYGFGYSCYVCFDEFMGAEYEIYKQEFEKGERK